MYAIHTGPVDDVNGKTDSKDYVYAGSIGYVESSKGSMTTMVGGVLVHPRFQVRFLRVQR